MKRLRTIVCLLILILTLPGVLALRGRLPGDVRSLIEKKYGGWSGVLRLWVCTDRPVAAWLNRCVNLYEKRHPGVYVQPEVVTADALTAEGLTPPDMILFPPGSVGAPMNMTAPVLTDGYMWAYNTSLIDGVPNTWRGLTLAVPEDRGAALLALCSGKYSENSIQAEPSGELELGLLLDDSENTPTPAPTEGTFTCALPEGFTFDPDAWRHFINGEAAAMIVTAREVRRLEALQQGLDWRLGSAGSAAFTDQVLYIGVLNQESGEKLDLCRGFVEHLRSEECQGLLHTIDAFSVTGAASGYPAGDSLTAMESMLRQKPLIVPGPFDMTWRNDADAIVREFVGGGGDPSALLGQLAARLSQKPEHSG